MIEAPTVGLKHQPTIWKLRVLQINIEVQKGPTRLLSSTLFMSSHVHSGEVGACGRESF